MSDQHTPAAGPPGPDGDREEQATELPVTSRRPEGLGPDQRPGRSVSRRRIRRVRPHRFMSSGWWHHRRRRWVRRLPRLAPWLWLAALPAGGSLALGCLLWLHLAGSRSQQAASVPDPSAVWLDQPDAAWARRPVYRYSVIPGGVRSASELKAAIANDRVLAAHYRDFDLRYVHLIRLQAARAVYVSYRLNNQIFWTDRKVNLPAGEELITDGVHSARARCGNIILSFRREKVSPQQPPLPDLDIPETPDYYSGGFPPSGLLPGLPASPSFGPPMGPQPVPGLTIPGAPETPSGGLAGPPVFPGALLYPRSCTPTSNIPPGGVPRFPPCSPPCIPTKSHPCGTPPGITPEPGTVLLYLTGIGYLTFRLRRLKTAAARRLQG